MTTETPNPDRIEIRMIFVKPGWQGCSRAERITKINPSGPADILIDVDHVGMHPFVAGATRFASE